jgi:SAM-dependent methyltransferase
VTQPVDYSLHYSKFHSESDAHFRQADRQYGRILAPILRDLPRTSRMLDFGCGTGLLVNSLRVRGYERVEGVDISPQQINVAQRRGLPCQAVSEDYARIAATTSADTMDCIFLMDVLEHVQKQEQIQLLEHLGQMLRPGGRLVISVPNANSTFASRWRYLDWTHECSFTEDSLEFVLLNAGFSAVAFHSYEFSAPPEFPYLHQLSTGTWLLRHLSRAFRRLEAIGELGREGLRISLSLNLLATASKAV